MVWTNRGSIQGPQGDEGPEGPAGADGGTTPHHTRHATGGDDALVPSDIGAAAASHTHASADVNSGTLGIARIPTGTTSSTVSLGDHNHDTRYYTETEVDTALSGKAASSHTHAAADVNSGTLGIARIPTGTSSTTVSLGNHTHAASLVPFAPVTFTDGATITLDASLGTFFRGSLAGDRTLAVPTNGTDGQRLLVEALASSAQRVLTIHASILWASSITSPITIPSGKRWFGGLLLSSGTWYLIASAVQG